LRRRWTGARILLGVDLGHRPRGGHQRRALQPVSGYSVIAAESLDGAIEMAKGCPILEGGGSIEPGSTAASAVWV
jgi:hypothetical protein